MAILRDGQPVAEYTWQAAGRHTTQLLPIVDRICRDVSLPLDAWSGVAVATGPGSFNGVRAAIATALGLAMSRDVPLIGVGTLDILAYQAYLGAAVGQLDAGTRICAILPAGRGEVYYALYAPEQALEKSGSWATAARIEGPAVATAEHLRDRIRENQEGAPLIVCGSVTPDLAEMLRSADERAMTLPTPASSSRRATYLALLAQQFLDAGGTDQLLTVTPLYLRRVTVTQSRRPLSISVAGGA